MPFALDRCWSWESRVVISGFCLFPGHTEFLHHPLKEFVFCYPTFFHLFLSYLEIYRWCVTSNVLLIGNVSLSRRN